MSEQTDVLGQLGLELQLEPDDLVSDALLIMKVHRGTGEIGVMTRVTPGTDWVTLRGMVAVAEDVESCSTLADLPDDGADEGP